MPEPWSRSLSSPEVGPIPKLRSHTGSKAPWKDRTCSRHSSHSALARSVPSPQALRTPIGATRVRKTPRIGVSSAKTTSLARLRHAAVAGRHRRRVRGDSGQRDRLARGRRHDDQQRPLDSGRRARRQHADARRQGVRALAVPFPCAERAPVDGSTFPMEAHFVHKDTRSDALRGARCLSDARSGQMRASPVCRQLFPRRPARKSGRQCRSRWAAADLARLLDVCRLPDDTALHGERRLDRGDGARGGG